MSVNRGWRSIVSPIVAGLLLAASVGVGITVFPPPVSAARGLRIITRVDTTDPVVFITIDDGFRTPWITDWVLDQLKWPITNFLVSTPVFRNYRWFNQLTPHVTWGTHTRHHQRLDALSLDEQKAEICGGADDLKRASGKRPVWFRPPGGRYDATTFQAAADCGMKAILLWRVGVNGTRVDTWGGPIRRGDIILLHYRNDLALSLVSLRTQLDALGLHPAPLDDYLPYR